MYRIARRQESGDIHRLAAAFGRGRRFARVDRVGLGQLALGMFAMMRGADGVERIAGPAHQHQHQKRPAHRAHRLGHRHRVEHGSPIWGLVSRGIYPLPPSGFKV